MKFPWQALSVILGEATAIDVGGLEFSSESEAHQFLLSYGYDLFEPAHVQNLWKIYDQAIQFIERRLCSADLKFPPELKDHEKIGDIKRLLWMLGGGPAPDPSFEPLKPWVCAVFRVMHTVSHLQSDLRLKYLPKIKRQTVDRFEAHIQRAKVGEVEQVFLGFERDKVPLVSFRKKESKVRDHILLKLLQKPSNVAQEIYDHIGVRFVTETRAESLLVIRYLLQHHLVSYPNIMPMRSRNSLVDLWAFKRLTADLEEGAAIDWKSIDEGLPAAVSGSDENPYSSKDYRSIQFTSRTLIRIPMIRKGVKSEMSFFFPVEVQILDKASYEASLEGDAAHTQYKQKQLEAVRKRVLGSLLS